MVNFLFLTFLLYHIRSHLSSKFGKSVKIYAGNDQSNMTTLCNMSEVLNTPDFQFTTLNLMPSDFSDCVITHNLFSCICCLYSKSFLPWRWHLNAHIFQKKFQTSYSGNVTGIYSVSKVLVISFFSFLYFLLHLLKNYCDWERNSA